jgi:hypothetical protein
MRPENEKSKQERTWDGERWGGRLRFGGAGTGHRQDADATFCPIHEANNEYDAVRAMMRRRVIASLRTRGHGAFSGFNYRYVDDLRFKFPQVAFL